MIKTYQNKQAAAPEDKGPTCPKCGKEAIEQLTIGIISPRGVIELWVCPDGHRIRRFPDGGTFLG